MAKSSNKKRKTGKTATKEQIEKERIVTMEALDEDASSGDEMPPEEEWNKEARALRQAIAEGAFEGLVKNSRKKKGADDDDDDDESFEEVVLGDDDEESEEEDDANDEDVEVEDEKAVKQDKDDSSSSEEEAGDLKKLVAAASDSEEEEDDDDDEEEDTIDRRNDMSSKALLVVTEELAAAKKHVPWAEQLFVVPPTPLPFGPDAEGEAQLGIHDDLKREVAFYDMALESVTEARLLCKEAGIPFTRPDDFFAEMVKDDGTFFVVALAVCCHVVILCSSNPV
jgi:rRNA-processing protein EBP2